MITILLVTGSLVAISFLLTSRGRSIAKLSPYECGIEPIGDARVELKIIYYILGILYLLFDLEIIFLYPLAVSLWLINNYLGFICVLLFIVLVTLTFIYEWFKGALEF